MRSLRFLDTTKVVAKRLANRWGVELRRWPIGQVDYLFAQAAVKLGAYCVLDVGANEGQFAESLRRHGYAERIHSYEPLRVPYDRLQTAAKDDPRWFCERLALGAAEATLQINIASNGGASSSFRDMTPLHVKTAPGAVFIGVEQVHVTTLAAEWARLNLSGRPVLLKVDTQGYENEVLSGIEESDWPGICAVLLELSFAELYLGAWDHLKVLLYMAERGFRLVALQPVLWEQPSGVLLQADGVFVRDSLVGKLTG